MANLPQPRFEARYEGDALPDLFGSGTGVHYDRIVDVTTDGHDRLWKEALLARLEDPRRILDLACGTGILTYLMRDRWPDAEIVGVDINDDYLDVARARARHRGDDRVSFLTSPVEDVVLSGTFDAIVSCYLPKYVDLSKVVPGLVRFLAPGGVLAFQDFAYPPDPGVRRVWAVNFLRCKEWARENLPEAVKMMEILPGIVRRSRWFEDLDRVLRGLGFEDVRTETFDHAQAALVHGRRPAA